MIIIVMVKQWKIACQSVNNCDINGAILSKIKRKLGGSNNTKIIVAAR